jgi:hypothetical protein
MIFSTQRIRTIATVPITATTNTDTDANSNTNINTKPTTSYEPYIIPDTQASNGTSTNR